MTPEKEIELTVKIDLLIDMVREQNSLIRRQGEQIAALQADVSELKGRVADIPTARDFGHLEGRLAEISARQPVTLAYSPPEQRRV